MKRAEIERRMSELAADCNYSPDGGGDDTVDALIDYKDGLEFLLIEAAEEEN